MNKLPKLPPLASAEEMRQWDKESIHLGVPGIVLMENAAQASLRVLQGCIADLYGKNVALLMGGGNNGGDAACLARLLLDMGACPAVYHIKPLSEAKGDARIFAELAQKCGVPFRDISEWDGSCEILVDGLLGTGFSGTMRPHLQDLVRLCNDKKAARLFTLALDIPSGLDAQYGLPCPCAIEADATATFAAAKPGLVMPHAAKYTGRLHVCYIGTPKKAQKATAMGLLTERLLDFLPHLQTGGYKNRYGHVAVIGGACGMSGAAHIAALAALRCGAGLCTVAAPKAGIDEVRLGRPEIMTLGLGAKDEEKWPASLPDSLQELLKKASSVVIGPGMGRGEDARAFLSALLPFLAREDKPVVLDADALVLLGQNSWQLPARTVLTPHPGEARCLAPGLTLPNQAQLVRLLSDKYQCTAVLKGAGSLVAAPGCQTVLYPQDIPQLSCGGSGDCLAGVIGALLGALAEDAADPAAGMLSACLGVVLHGTAGRLLARDYPERGCLASDIVSMLPRVRKLHHEGLLEEALKECK